MKTRLAIAAAVVVLFGWTAASAIADDAAGGKAGAAARVQRLTPAERAAVKSLLEQFRADMKPLRAELRAEVQKLRDLRRSGAGSEALKAQVAVVKGKAEALKARWLKLRDDLRAAVPPEVFERIQKRFRQRFEQFLDNHPRLKERWERRHQRGAEGAAGQ